MCKCNSGATGQCSCGSSASLESIFHTNQVAIAEVFKKNGAGHLPVTPAYAGALANILGEDFENDLGNIIFPDDVSEAANDEDKKAKRRGKVKNFFKGLGNGVKSLVGANGADMAAQIAGTVPANAQQAVTPKQECSEGYELDEKKGICVKKPTILGFTYAQAGMVGLLIVGVVVLLVMNKKASGNK